MSQSLRSKYLPWTLNNILNIALISLMVIAFCGMAGCSSDKIVTARAIGNVNIVQHNIDEIIFEVRSEWPNTCGEFSHFEVDKKDHKYTITLLVKSCKNCGCGDELVSIVSDLRIEVPEPGQYNFYFVSDSRYTYNALRFDWQIPMGEKVATVEFANRDLEKGIENKLYPYDSYDRGLYPFELEKVTTVDVPYSTVHDLTGLEYCVNLTTLGLEQNSIEDISPITNLTCLEDIDLAWNKIEDISPLKGLTNLSVLDLEWNDIIDISPLLENSGFNEGTEIHLTGNPLNSQSVGEYIPQLIERGVNVTWD